MDWFAILNLNIPVKLSNQGADFLYFILGIKYFLGMQKISDYVIFKKKMSRND